MAVMPYVIPPSPPCRLCYGETKTNSRRLIFSESFGVLDEMKQIPGMDINPDNGDSHYCCIKCYAILNKLSRINFDLANKTTQLEQQKLEILTHLSRNYAHGDVSINNIECEETETETDSKDYLHDLIAWKNIFSNSTNESPILKGKNGNMHKREYTDSDGATANEFYVILDRAYKYPPDVNIDTFVKGKRFSILRNCVKTNMNERFSKYVFRKSGPFIQLVQFYEGDIPIVKWTVSVNLKFRPSIYVQQQSLRRKHSFWSGVPKCIVSSLDDLQRLTHKLNIYFVCTSTESSVTSQTSLINADSVINKCELITSNDNAVCNQCCPTAFHKRLDTSPPPISSADTNTGIKNYVLITTNENAEFDKRFTQTAFRGNLNTPISFTNANNVIKNGQLIKTNEADAVQERLVTLPPPVESGVSPPKKMKKKDFVPKRCYLTMAQKVDVINKSEKQHISRKQLAHDYGVGRTQIDNIMQNKGEVINDYMNNVPDMPERRLLSTGNSEINGFVLEWWLDATNSGSKVTGAQMKNAALGFAADLGIMKFKASNGWLESFKHRNGI